MAEQSNRNLANRIAACLILVGIFSALGLWLFPKPYIAFLDRTPLKAALFLTNCGFLVLMGLAIYRIFHLPSAKRLILRGINTIIFLGITVTLGSAGLLAIEKFDLHVRGDSFLSVAYSPHESAPYLSLAITGILILLLVREYRLADERN